MEFFKIFYENEHFGHLTAPIIFEKSVKQFNFELPDISLSKDSTDLSRLSKFLRALHFVSKYSKENLSNIFNKLQVIFPTIANENRKSVTLGIRLFFKVIEINFFNCLFF